MSQYAIGLILACGALALLYGFFSIRSILSLSTGNAQMQSIASAIQEGARAYLYRQYSIIALVGLAIFALLTWLLGWYVGIGYLIGAFFVGDCRFCWDECLCTRQCAHDRSCAERFAKSS